MPYKPKKPCRYPGCNRVTHGTYCDEHQKMADKEYNKNGRDMNLQRFYNSKEWRRLRNLKLSYCPLCEECLNSGRLIKANTVDHITPIGQGGAPLELGNLQSLCRECHSRKSAKEGSRWGKNKIKN